jgi:SAM-dependent methyltransferase
MPAWHWYWAGAMLTGTYLFYQGGDQMVWVKWAWIGWLVILVLGVGIGSLQEIQFRRGGTKFRWMESAIPPSETPLEVLDLGAGEGFVGFWMEKKLNAHVTLADVINLNQTNLPHFIYDGKKLPFADQSFDVTVLSFVLHHCEDQDSVIQEAMRVTRKRILILESVYISKWDLKQLTFLDRLANRLRSGGLMKAQEEHLYFRTVKDWTIFFKSKGLRIALIREKGLFVHQQAFFALDVSMPRV